MLHVSIPLTRRNVVINNFDIVLVRLFRLFKKSGPSLRLFIVHADDGWTTDIQWTLKLVMNCSCWGEIKAARGLYFLIPAWWDGIVLSKLNLNKPGHSQTKISTPYRQRQYYSCSKSSNPLPNRLFCRVLVVLTTTPSLPRNGWNVSALAQKLFPATEYIIEPLVSDDKVVFYGAILSPGYDVKLSIKIKFEGINL